MDSFMDLVPVFHGSLLFVLFKVLYPLKQLSNARLEHGLAVLRQDQAGQAAGFSESKPSISLYMTVLPIGAQEKRPDDLFTRIIRPILSPPHPCGPGWT